MNRNRRIKKSKFNVNNNGYNGEKDTFEIGIVNSDEKLVIDITNSDIVNNIEQFYEKFSNIHQRYKEDCQKVSDTTSNFQLTKKIVYDFSDSVENIWGEGSCIKLFGHRYPNPAQIEEFMEQLEPLVPKIINASNISKMRKENAK